MIDHLDAEFIEERRLAVVASGNYARDLALPLLQAVLDLLCFCGMAGSTFLCGSGSFLPSLTCAR